MKKKKINDKQSIGVYVRLTPNESKSLRSYAKHFKLSMAEAMRSASAEKLFYFNH